MEATVYSLIGPISVMSQGLVSDILGREGDDDIYRVME